MITAVDIGASKTLVAQFNHAGKIENSVKFATPKNQEEFYEELAPLLKRLHDIDILVVGVPGIVDSLGVVRRCGILPWVDFDLKGQLNSDFSCPVVIENDAKLAAIGEANSISPVPGLCLYLTISTGIGEGVVQNGKLVQALKYSEAGHMVLNSEGSWQIWQNIASGKAIKEHFGKLAKDITDPDDWQWIANKVALGLLALIPTLQPEIIIFGGGVGHYFANFGDKLAKELDKNLPKYIERPKLTGAKHAEEAVIYGCYYYATHYHDS